METNKNKIVLPYFENGIFAGVRVTLGDEDFVIAAKDFQDGKTMNWMRAKDALKSKGFDTWNYRQTCLTMAYRDEINKVLADNNGDILFNLYRIHANATPYGAFRYFGQNNTLEIISKYCPCRIRLVKNLKNA